ncbi:MAG: PAS domain S-box protein [Chloroflexi bacterium]|nr:PAS domain S-box protein [Chloroflexota bacterium]
MVASLFDASTYVFGPYVLPPLITAAVTFLLGIAVLIRERGSFVSLCFFVIILAITDWLFGFSMMYAATTEATARWWLNIGNLGVPFIGPAVYLFTVTATGALPRRRIWVGLNWLNGAFFAVVFTQSDLLITGFYRYEWGFYPRFGVVGAIFIAIFIGQFVWSLGEQWTAYRRASPGVYKLRLKSFMQAFAIGYVGAVDYVPSFGVPIYPFGFLTILVFLLLHARTIRRYRLVDLTPRFAAEQIVSTMADPLIVCDAEGKIRLVNDVACEVFGHPRHELIGRPLECLTDSGPGQTDRLRELLRRQEARDEELVFYTRAGEPVSVSLSATRLPDRDRMTVGTVIIARDVRERKRAEAEIRSLNTTLEQRVIERTAQLEAAVASLEGEIAERQRAEAALRSSEERYRDLFENANDIIYTHDLAGNVTSVNRIAEQIIGYTRAEALRLNIAQLIAPEQLPAIRERLAQKAAGAPAATYELELVAKDGQRIPVEVNARVLHEEAGAACTGFQGIARDIRERRRAEAEQRRLLEQIEHERATLAAVTAGMSDGLALIDSSGALVYSNERAHTLLGLDPAALVAFLQAAEPARWATIERQLVDSQAARADWQRARHATETAVQFELGLVGPPRRDVLVDLFPVRDEGDGRIVQGLLLRDVTDERALARTKDELIAVVSHELRTPLACVLGVAELLLLRTLSPEEQHEMLQMMIREGQRLTALLNDFLDLQRIESGRQPMRPAPLKLGEVLQSAVRAVGQDAERPIVLEVAEPLPLVTADEERIQQVLVNLLTNARKYSPEGGEVRLAARALNGAVEISVQDHGLGLPSESLGQLFEKFYRVDNSDRRAIKGTGLGLAICREIVTAHNGKIWVESAGLGQGARFSFTLPVSAALRTDYVSPEAAASIPVAAARTGEPSG